MPHRGRVWFRQRATRVRARETRVTVRASSGRDGSVAGLMRVGVYVDAFNLYYGGRAHFGGGGVAGWRWLDIRRLASTLLGEPGGSWSDARVERVTYCTARISARDNPGGAQDQDVYLKALLDSRSVDHIEYGYYTSKVKSRPLALPDRKNRPKLVHPDWPVKVKASRGPDDPDATFMVTVADREEKGSDVNVATPW